MVMRTVLFLIGTIMACGIPSHAQSLERQTGPADFRTTCHQLSGRIVCRMPFVLDSQDESTVRYCLNGKDGEPVCFPLTKPPQKGAAVSPEDFERQQKLLREELNR